eukprot:TRINITY_DN14753_c0_g1::TRINITY_DN14753_c0_g1_i1::g.30175::m.30175 TRINITY_DN14753_c0_g1::TRINITY_DN14753_c0_g1_i1::g.30175  ORF type:complete len:737 (-),score=35.16,sp/Q5R9H4/A1CF_PONAB/29.64/8e-21,RRM_1/PF00076.17/0.0017,RRM_1/PF00076.17/1.7e-06,RRM_1/PF00076.17/4.7e-06,RRM_6/PF14259.1/0.024,RRM_6/PF14259.1/1.7e-09,RRM_6/PF14259.1/0.009,RRM_5/PF13893.1/1.6e+02,RRM_5/PF13893.1/0.00086,RRM_5/PF13893.1/7.4e-07,RRM_5/PF13893.1/4.7e+03,SpoU_methylase/PF00588.14/2.6e+03,SpoU_methylase/PF00588.14/0.0
MSPLPGNSDGEFEDVISNPQIPFSEPDILSLPRINPGSRMDSSSPQLSRASSSSATSLPMGSSDLHLERKNREIGILNLPADITLEELRELVQPAGTVTELILEDVPEADVSKFPESKVGYVLYDAHESARTAIFLLCKHVIRDHTIVIRHGNGNRYIFLRRLPKTSTEEEVHEWLRAYTDQVIKVQLFQRGLDQAKHRGYAFLEFSTHTEAAIALQKMLSGTLLFNNAPITAEWAKENKPENKQSTVCLKNVHHLSEDHVQKLCEKYGQVAKVTHKQDTTFVKFHQHEHAVECVQQLNNTFHDGRRLNAYLARSFSDPTGANFIHRPRLKRTPSPFGQPWSRNDDQGWAGVCIATSRPTPFPQSLRNYYTQLGAAICTFVSFHAQSGPMHSPTQAAVDEIGMFLSNASLSRPLMQPVDMMSTYAQLCSQVPLNSTWIAVGSRGIPLPLFHHPPNALYVFAEGPGAAPEVLDRCKTRVCIPTIASTGASMNMNMHSSSDHTIMSNTNVTFPLPISILFVLYDRIAKQYRNSTSNQNSLALGQHHSLGAGSPHLNMGMNNSMNVNSLGMNINMNTFQGNNFQGNTPPMRGMTHAPHPHTHTQVPSSSPPANINMSMSLQGPHRGYPPHLPQHNHSQAMPQSHSVHQVPYYQHPVSPTVPNAPNLPLLPPSNPLSSYPTTSVTMSQYPSSSMYTLDHQASSPQYAQMVYTPYMPHSPSTINLLLPPHIVLDPRGPFVN